MSNNSIFELNNINSPLGDWMVVRNKQIEFERASRLRQDKLNVSTQEPSFKGLLINNFSGNSLIDGRGNPVLVNVDGENVTFNLTGDYEDKQREKLAQLFKEKSLPALKAMAKTEMGRMDLKELINIPTRTDIKINYAKTPGAFSNVLTHGLVRYTAKDGAEKEGYYKRVTIKPHLGNYFNSKEFWVDLDEWYGAIMNTEVGHINKEQIDREFKYGSDAKKWQGPLYNKHVEYRIRYRDQVGKPLNDHVFKLLDIYNLTHSEYNKQRRIDFNKTK